MERILNIRLVLALVVLGSSLSGCSMDQQEEAIGGVTVPIPRGMSKAEDERVEFSIPGFGAIQVTYRGRVTTDKIISFYQKEMPARGWKPNASLVTRGGVLAYSKDNKNVLIMISQNGSDSTLSIAVAGTGP